jgi:hypothetical protein
MVVALSFILLMIVFRSLAIPAAAAVMNLLSAAAAFGVITAVFQWGWLKSLVGVTNTGPISPFIPSSCSPSCRPPPRSRQRPSPAHRARRQEEGKAPPRPTRWSAPRCAKPSRASPMPR